MHLHVFSNQDEISKDPLDGGGGGYLRVLISYTGLRRWMFEIKVKKKRKKKV
jgi:hypothetical protein